MGFFDKKYCDFCGAKIGLLGNRKLEDGVPFRQEWDAVLYSSQKP